MTNTNLIGRVVRILFLSTVSLSISSGQTPGKAKESETLSVAKGSGSPSYSVLTVGAMTAWFKSDGLSNRSLAGDNGSYFPKGTGNVIYRDGFVWGSKLYLDPSFTQPAPAQPIRVGGGAHGVGTQAGYVTGSGATAVATNPGNTDVRIYRIRRDFGSLFFPDGSPTSELQQETAWIHEIPVWEASFEQMMNVYQQYETDWNEWPVHLGAPYIERNGIPGYQPPLVQPMFLPDSLEAGNYDEPGIVGPDMESPAHQVIFLIYNDLDEGQSISFERSLPTGLEIQKTIWAYKGGFPIENIYFTRYRIINKGGVDVDTASGMQKGSFYLDSMFVSQWSDPDLGSFSDDLIGCDIALNTGFVYNANNEDATFRNFGLPPPAAGYRLLQGPLVPAPSDSAISNFRVIQGSKNLPMTSFAYFGNPTPFADPPNGEAEGYESMTGQWWKMLRGYVPLGTINDPDIPYPRPEGTPSTSFPLSGDPVTGTGFLDGRGTNYSFIHGDRRFLVSAGPFALSPGDTQEVIVATVYGLGADRLSSIGVMRAAARFAGTIHSGLFSVPRAPAPPEVKATELDGQVILEWGSTSRSKQTESTIVAQRYFFEGYNVYQLPLATSDLSDGVKIATFDVQNGVRGIIAFQYDLSTGTPIPTLTQTGTDNGVERFISIERDRLTTPFKRLNNGQEYHFAVTAYNYSPEPGIVPGSFESPPTRISGKPKIPFGIISTLEAGDSLAVSHTEGLGEGTVVALVVDPLVLTGSPYTVRFRLLENQTVWDLENTTTGSQILSAQTTQDGGGASSIVDGIQVRVFNAPRLMRDFLVVANANGILSPPEYGAFAFNASGFPHPSTADRPNGTRQQSSGLTTSQGWGIHVPQEGITVMTYMLFLDRVSGGGANWPMIHDGQLEIRFTAAGGKASNGLLGPPTIDVPFELWNIRETPNDPSDDYRMIPIISDADSDGVFSLRPIDHSSSSDDDDPETEAISWYQPQNKNPGQAGYLAWESGGALPGNQVLANMVLVLWNGGNVTDPAFPANASQLLPETGTVFRIVTRRKNSPSDVFSFTAPLVQFGLEAQKASAKRVGVFPNPYYAGRSQETQSWRNFVTFNNLPPRATIRIFNLAGHLLRTIEKNDPSQFLEWDLRNKDNWQVASGIYVCYVEMPDIGETKILKVAVIQPRVSPY